MSKISLLDYTYIHMWYSVKESRQTNVIVLSNKENKKYIITSFSSLLDSKPIYNDAIYIGYDNVKYNYVLNNTRLSKPYFNL